MLRSKAEEKQETAARLVWSLSFNDGVKKKIKEEPGCVEALEDLSKSKNPAVKRQASGALWNLRKAEKVPPEIQPESDGEASYMISSIGLLSSEDILKA